MTAVLHFYSIPKVNNQVTYFGIQHKGQYIFFRVQQIKNRWRMVRERKINKIAKNSFVRGMQYVKGDTVNV